MDGRRSPGAYHLIPGIGQHATDRLQPEHIEKLYAKLRAKGLKPATVHQVHRTLRTALNEAVRRGQIARNPATLAKAPRVTEEEIQPFTVTEAQRILAQPTGKPVDPRADYAEWQALLKAAAVRPARLHDARHTAATMLLVVKVPTRAVMDVMGWSQVSMTSRYQHVPDEVLRDIAHLVGGLLWQAEADDTDSVS